MRKKREAGFKSNPGQNDPRLIRMFFSSFLLLNFFSACSVPLYKVAPLPQNIATESGTTQSTNSFEISASAIIDDDKAFERFEANLPWAGIVAVDVKITNRSNRELQPKFELRDDAGKKYSPIEAKQELKRLMNFEGVRVYAREGREKTLERLSEVMFPKKFNLAVQSDRQGVLFFNTKKDVTLINGLILIVKDGSDKAEMRLK